MNNPNLAYIYGPKASGKGVLARLLDGHPELAVTPIHDAFPKAMGRISNHKAPIKKKFFREFRKDLNNTRYYQIEDINNNTYPNIVSSSDNYDVSTTDLNFYKADEEWAKKIKKRGFIDTEFVLREIFRAIFRNWSNYPYCEKKCEYYVGMGDFDPEPMQKFVKECASSKVIFISRDPRGAIASEGSRPTTNSINYYIKNGRAADINNQLNTIKNLKKRYKNKILIISFNELILKTDDTMERVSKFLGIKDKEILYKPTACGIEIPKEDYIGEVLDNWEKILSDSQKCAIDLQMGKMPKELNFGGLSLYASFIKRSAILDIHDRIITQGKRFI